MKNFKFIKRTAILLLAGVMCVSVCGCGKSKEKKEEDKGIDPFSQANVQVTFDGNYPFNTVTFTPEDLTLAGVKLAEFSIDKQSGVKTGDEVTVTATVTPEGKQKGYKDSSKKFPVENVSSYVTKLDEIPSDTMDKLKKQAEDVFTAEAANWKNDDECQTKLDGIEFLGCYFQLHKPVSDGRAPDKCNKVMLAYKISMTITAFERSGDGKTPETGKYDYYVVYCYDNLIIMPDGTLSVALDKGYKENGRFETDYGWYGFWGNAEYFFCDGWKDIDSMFNEEIASHTDVFEYESTVNG